MAQKSWHQLYKEHLRLARIEDEKLKKVLELLESR